MRALTAKNMRRRTEIKESVSKRSDYDLERWATPVVYENQRRCDGESLNSSCAMNGQCEGKRPAYRESTGRTCCR